MRAAAAATVRDGRSVSLSYPLATEPGPENLEPVQHEMRLDDDHCSDFIGIAYHGRANTHLDALCHVYTRAGGELFGGRSSSEHITMEGATTLSVDHWREGIVTRGVLYDIPRLRGVDHVTTDAPVHGWELADAAAAAGIEPRAGDAVVIRSGAGPFYAARPGFPEGYDDPSRPGVHASCLEFFHAVATVSQVIGLKPGHHRAPWSANDLVRHHGRLMHPIFGCAMCVPRPEDGRACWRVPAPLRHRLVADLPLPRRWRCSIVERARRVGEDGPISSPPGARTKELVDDQQRDPLLALVQSGERRAVASPRPARARGRRARTKATRWRRCGLHAEPIARCVLPVPDRPGDHDVLGARGAGRELGDAAGARRRASQSSCSVLMSGNRAWRDDCGRGVAPDLDAAGSS